MSSYNTSDIGEKTNGRPRSDDDEISGSGERTRNKTDENV